MPPAGQAGRKTSRFSSLMRQVLLYAFGLVPGLLDITQGVLGTLGANPVAACLHAFGSYAFRFLLLSLTITLVRRFIGVNLILYRRPLGLLAFTYAAAHVFFYVGATRHFEGHILWRDFTSRPFLTFGFLAFLILVVLAATSTKRTIRALGRKWAVVHRFVYAALVLACVHYSLAFKTWHIEPFIYAGIAVALLGLRVVKKPARQSI
ncbi:sulfite oxidase heme-binding subunit YedZ [Acetobacter orientalis]|uniref:sulfite oxidase heme-binding subunit YedZ n=1 Tax=Acetobacter orientalis TaxID=146474 RepID=UPI0039ED2E67